MGGAGEALVVGGSVHQRLSCRGELRTQGFRVTVEPSLTRGLKQLNRYPFAVCAVDLTDGPQANRWRRAYTSASRTCGVKLVELSR